MKENIFELNLIEIIGTFTNPDEAIPEIMKLKPEILFLDVQMPKYSGFDVVRHIKSEVYSPHLIFVTAYEKFAIQAIEYAALAYLKKPVDPIALKEKVNLAMEEEDKKITQAKLEKLLKKLESNQHIKFNTSTGFTLIYPPEIIYLEADGNYCDIFLTNDRIETVTTNMNQVSKKLKPDEFFKISRWNFINLSFLRKVERRSHLCFLVENKKEIRLEIKSKNAKELEKILEGNLPNLH
ncbi:MAG: response regulator transcription factor [Bacteroidetes bacterium]|nr:response regulator transcription factor [Bacteroidota bacterium]